MCRGPKVADAAEPTDSTAPLKVAGGAAAFYGLSKFLPPAEFFATKPAFADCLQAAGVIFAMLWGYELAARSLLGMARNAHPVLARCSAAASRQATAKQMAALHIKFPSGLVRGALWGLGVQASVSAEVSEVPRCQFTIRLAAASAPPAPVS